MQLPGLRGLRIHRPAAGDRRAGRDGAESVLPGPISKRAVPVLRAAEGPDQRAVLGGGRIRAAL